MKEETLMTIIFISSGITILVSIEKFVLILIKLFFSNFESRDLILLGQDIFVVICLFITGIYAFKLSKRMIKEYMGK